VVFDSVKNIFKAENYEIALAIKEFSQIASSVFIVMLIILILSVIPGVKRPILKLIKKLDEWLRIKP
jgi:hypothetical protein